jgi:hypothetical protein
VLSVPAPDWGSSNRVCLRPLRCRVFELIRRARNGGAAVLCAFDLIELDGKDLRRIPIEQRLKLAPAANLLGLFSNDRTPLPATVACRRIKLRV